MLNWKELGPQSTDRGRRFSGVDLQESSEDSRKGKEGFVKRTRGSGGGLVRAQKFSEGAETRGKARGESVQRWTV